MPIKKFYIHKNILLWMKIGWILSGDMGVASARIQGWNMHKLFLKRGINSKIIYSPNGFQTKLNLSKRKINEILIEGYDCIILQKIQKWENFSYFIRKAHKNGIKIIYIGIDSINIKFAIACDGILTVTDFLKKQIPIKYRKKTFIVFDSYEHPKNLYKRHNNSKKINLIFVSNDVFSIFPQIEFLPKNVSLTIIGPPKERARKWQPNQEIFTKTPYKFKYLVWNIKRVNKEILKSDVGVIPYPKKNLKQDYIKTKSSNRLIMFMSFGLPTIASPIPSYKDLIKQGKNGFIAKNLRGWIKIIEMLRDNPKIRKIIGIQARKDVINKYSLEKQGELYLKIIKKVL
jgi:glycosyltransferase involved in cell wall biosynthesis